jgi:hypothetical protein
MTTTNNHNVQITRYTPKRYKNSSPNQHHIFFRIIFSLLACTLSLASLTSHAQTPKAPNSIDYAMYFLGDVRDNEHCAMQVKDGEFVVAKKISNPAMTCPDMTSWRLFASVIHDKFWSDWADETQNWPANPWQLCSASQTTNCCAPHSLTNDKEHCPYFPGDFNKQEASTNAKLLTSNSTRNTNQFQRVGRPSITHQLQTITTGVELERVITELKKTQKLTAAATKSNECPASVVKQLVPKTYESIGRVIRQTNAEVTIRNRSFHDYLFDNNLYNSNGVAAVFAVNDANQKANAPYSADSYSASGARPGKLSKIDLPPDAIMIKSNWLYDGIARELNIKDSKDAPFITQKMTTVVQFTKGKETVNCNLTGTHYLMAFHVSSKDTPNWVWTTFEHIAMPGRCDFIGCNDSYGYSSTDKLPAGTAKNYTAPHVKSDNLLMAPAIVFDTDKLYPVEKINPGLNQVFNDLGIGTTASTNRDNPGIADLGWRSYRLKGSQVEFTNSMGRKTLLGNSITEAGFMNGSSCITCHSRAGIHVEQNKANFFRLSVFEKNLSDYGYSLSAHGIPNPEWYHHDDNAGSLDVLQTDFVWGFLNANPITN